MDGQVEDAKLVDVVDGGREDVGPDSSTTTVAAAAAAAASAAVEADTDDETDMVTNQNNKNQVLVEEESAVVASDLADHDSDNIVASPSTIETATSKEVGIEEEEEETTVMEDGDGGAADGGEKQTETAVATTTETGAGISSSSPPSSSPSSDVEEEDGSTKQTHNDTSTMDHSRAAEKAGSGTGTIPLKDTTREPNIERQLQQQQQLGSSDSDESVTRTSFKVVAGHDSVEIHEEEEQDQEQEGSVSDDAAGSTSLSPNADKDDDAAAESSMTGQKQEHEADDIGTRKSDEDDKEEEKVVENKSETAVAAVAASGVSKKAPPTATTSSSLMTVASDEFVAKQINVSGEKRSTANNEAGGRSYASQMIAVAASETMITATLSSLPIDSLHSIASFLAPKEWSNFSICNKASNKICRDVVRRVRLHGFKCAMEVVTAWKLGQHADAKELCALYIQSGVPIYPSCFGHSYHTLLWRMHAEVKHIQETSSSTESTSSGTSMNINIDNNVARGETPASLNDGAVAESRLESLENGQENQSVSNTGARNNRSQTALNERTDPFYLNRDEARRTRLFVEEFGLLPTRGNALPFSYLEEKAVYTVQANCQNQPEIDRITQDLRRRMSLNPLARNANGQSLERRQPGENNPAAPILVGGIQNDIARADSMAIPATNSTPFGGARMTRSNSFSETGYRPPKVLMKVHRHLLDQHLLGRSSVCDGNGEMNSPTFSLSADFFHPVFSYRQRRHQNQHLAVLANSGNDALSTEGVLSGHLVPAWIDVTNDGSRLRHGNRAGHFDDGLNVPETLLDSAAHALRRATLNSDSSDESDDENEEESTVQSALHVPLHNRHNNNGNGHDNVPNAPQHMIPPLHPIRSLNALLRSVTSSPAAASTRLNYGHGAASSRRNWLENVDLEVYSASVGIASEDIGDEAIHQVKKHLKIRFAAYHRRLEKCLSNRDNAGYDECILDFWDEFLPQTANIHYYDRHTAVPRLSTLETFLTKPCPKAVGTVQCEIERIKVGSKKKGVNVKGRFFPTYEYRLFIRHRHADQSLESSSDDEHNEPRRDTVLMMAKNRGRKHVDSSGNSFSAFSSKKGSNNYYLQLPKQEDVEAHYKSVNGLESDSKPTANGAGIGCLPVSNPPLLGRLQSNFIGTEFQIFTPRLSKQVPKPKPFASASRSMSGPLASNGTIYDDDILNENEVSADHSLTSSGRRLGRFRKLSLLSRGNTQSDNNRSISEEDASGPADAPSSQGITLRRSQSSGDIVPSRKSRPSRRVSAADAPGSQNQLTSQVQPQPTFTEEEDGAITYTANLLGSRPRIMDVCIPRITDDGSGTDWRRYLENCDDPEVRSSMNNMLNHLKVLQQRSEVEEGDQENQDNIIGGGGGRDHGGEGGRRAAPSSSHGDPNAHGTYIPPDDFGLLALQNRPPWWNVDLGSFVLNFGGRVSVASVKNFQLCDRSDQDYIMLQFGRIAGRHSFTMDFQYPLTGVQAFAIAISSLQSKISFG